MKCEVLLKTKVAHFIEFNYSIMYVKSIYVYFKYFLLKSDRSNMIIENLFLKGNSYYEIIIS